MPSEIRVVDQKFFSKLKNGDSFNLDTGDYTNHLKGGVLEEFKAVFNVQVSWYAAINSYTYVYDNTANTLSIEVSGYDWNNNGFSVGDEVKFSIDSLQTSPTKAQITGIVSSITDGEIRLESVVETINSLQNGIVLIEGADDYVTGLSKKTALEYKFGLIENNEPINFISKLTNTEQILQFEGIDHNSPLTFVDGKSFGNNKAWVTGSSKVAFVQNVADKDYIYNELTTQEFQIEHIFKINPFYRDGEDDSLSGTDKPPLDIFNGSKSLKYVLQTDFRTVLNNPNTSIIGEYDTQEGSVGYFGESFNGFENDYSVSNLSYSLGDKLEVGAINSVSYDIDSASGLLATDTPIIVGHSAVVDSDSYDNNKEEYNTVWTNEIKRVVTNSGTQNGDLLKNIVITYVSANKVSVSFDVDFSTTQEGILTDGQEYILYYQVADNTQITSDSKKVTDLVDFNQYFKNNDVDGLFDVITYTQSPHPLINDYTNSKTFNESGQLMKSDFWVDNSAVLNTLDFDVVILKKSDNTWTDLRTLSIDISDSILVNGIKQIELDSTRNYKLKEGDSFNFLKITTGSNDGTKQFYSIEVGYKLPWEEWLELPNAPTDFYDKTDLFFNGLNQKSSNYSRKGTGLNTFVDGDNGTFESGVTGLTSLSYSVGTPNQIGGGITQTPSGVAHSGLFSAKISFSAPSMSEVSKDYNLFTTDTVLSVTEGNSYELVYYVASVLGANDPSHLDNGVIYLSPDGYTNEEIETDSFVITDVNLSPSEDALVWFKCSTFFTAKATATVLILARENIQTDITGSTGGVIYIDEITLKDVNYDIRALFRANVNSTDYTVSSEEIKVYDYSEDDTVQDSFSCEINTYNADNIPLLNNIINKEFTELRAEFIPLVPPVFTAPVDFTEVASEWGRFAHGNLNLAPSTSSPRSGVWANEQANDTDTFSAFGGSPSATKNDLSLYTSDPNSIQTTANMTAVYGCYSLDKFEYYDISGKMFSDDANDNDSLIFDIAFFTDEFGVENTLSLCATTGGVLHDLNPAYIEGDNQTTTILVGGSPYPAGWDLVYNFGKGDCRNLIHYETTKNGFDWGDAQVGDLMFSVQRSNKDITVNVDWTIDTVQFVNTFNFDLESDVDTEKFLGFNHLGFSFMSQAQGGFKDVVLTQASNDYYGILRIDEENAQTDNSISELSTLYEAPENNLLEQIDGTEKKAILSYDGTKFVLQGKVDTSNIDDSITYRFSAELRNRNLEL